MDPGDNSCPSVQVDRRANAIEGRWEELPGSPQITFVHDLLVLRELPRMKTPGTRALSWSQAKHLHLSFVDLGYLDIDVSK